MPELASADLPLNGLILSLFVGLIVLTVFNIIQYFRSLPCPVRIAQHRENHSFDTTLPRSVIIIPGKSMDSILRYQDFDRPLRIRKNNGLRQSPRD